MKKYYKGFIISVGLTLSLLISINVFAATTPPLGFSATYGVLSSTFTNTLSGTTVNGDVGFTTGPAVVPLGTHTNYGSGASYATAGIDQGSILSALAGEVCTFNFAPGAVDLSSDITHGPIGAYAPGVYCISGAATIGTGGITLNGNGTYIFRINGALTSVANSVVTLNGASACDVFWTPTQATTLAADTTFVGIVIDDAGITVGSNTVWTGQAMAFGGTVTTGVADIISVPSCSITVIPPASVTPAILHVIKQVTNNNSGTSTASLFNLHVKLSGTDVSGSPAVGVTAPGTSYSLSAGTYNVSEDVNTSYTQSFSGDCDANGNIILSSGDNKVCTITNDDIAPAVVIPAPAVTPATSTIKVVKIVINDNGGTKTVADFPLLVNGVSVSSGITNIFPSSVLYTVSEINDPLYSRTYSLDCNQNGQIYLDVGSNKTCIITNNDIATIVPVIVPVTVPTLPNTGFGPGSSSGISWNLIIPTCLLFSLFVFYSIKKGLFV